MRPRSSDLLLLSLPLLLLAAVLLAVRPVPAEDACILFRYADHLAAGHGIVWNIGEDPVEGATEFLWLLILAGASSLGMPLLSGAPWLGMGIAAGAAILLYAGARRVMEAGPPAVLAVSLAFGGSTAALHAGTGFGTPLYTLLLLAAFLLAWRLMTGPPSERAERALPAVVLLLALARPEGVAMGCALYVALWILRPSVFGKRFLARQALLLVLPGLAYFAWRWWYFGFPLPNTFYVKSSEGWLNHASAARIARFSVRFCAAPLLLGLLWLPRAPAQKRRAWLALAGVALFGMLLYLKFAMIQDLGFRFLFPSFAALLLLSAPALDGLLPRLREKSLGPASAASAALALVLAASGPWMVRASGYRGAFDDRYTIGVLLSELAAARPTMVATEAGYLPYLSRWRAVDPFGLNDEHIAHHGLTQDYLFSQSPDLVMFHVDTPHYAERWTPPGADRWEEMTKLLHRFTGANGYELAGVIPKSGRPEDGYHWYFCRSGADPRLFEIIREEALARSAPAAEGALALPPSQ
ncbi:MAG TPA: hypothetical protein VJV23_16630 [Candidatus Polarisedimenticolia bacterium]|nr:hypothetical protein [Candidatus Polarisedimenticolia bacterium]